MTSNKSGFDAGLHTWKHPLFCHLNIISIIAFLIISIVRIVQVLKHKFNNTFHLKKCLDGLHLSKFDFQRKGPYLFFELANQLY